MWKFFTIRKKKSPYIVFHGANGHTQETIVLGNAALPQGSVPKGDRVFDDQIISQTSVNLSSQEGGCLAT